MTETKPTKPILICDPTTGNFNFGTTYPKFFCTVEVLHKWGFTKRHAKDIVKNTRDENSEIYWEQWEKVVRDARMIDAFGVHWCLMEDDYRRVFMVPAVPGINLGDLMAEV